MRASSVAISAAVVLASAAAPARAQTEQPVRTPVIEFEPEPGSVVEVAGRRHAGLVRITAHENGLAVTETVDVDTYLLGILEVPFSWPMEALRAQAVAARTYLAWTLDRGPSQNGRRYGYDICATTACQVYAGLDAVLAPSGRPWRTAVETTADEVLLVNGSPIQALYSSTSGGRTRAVEDVFPGSQPSSYLRAVESPGEDSPFVRWEFRLAAADMEALLAAAGLLEGSLVDVETVVTADGAGPWTVVIEGSEGTRRIGTWSLRTELNRAAREVMSGRLPVLRPDGSLRRYPQTIMSPTYTITPETRLVPVEGGRPAFERVYRVAGRGWGHLVGMSQYGAEAMASRGVRYDQILAHYYGGITPSPAGAALPDAITVGLEIGVDEVSVVPRGPVTVRAGGVAVAERVLGSWSLGVGDGRTVMAGAPTGLGRPPAIRGPQVSVDSSGRVRVAATITAPAEVRLAVTRDGRRTYDSGVELRDAGVVEWASPALSRAMGSRATVTVSARAPQGADLGTTLVVAGTE